VTATQLDRTTAPRYRALGPRQLDEIADRFGLSDDLREVARTVSKVLPFRVNSHVLENLIDWSAVPEDPIYQLVFPQAGMLGRAVEARVRRLSKFGSAEELRCALKEIRRDLNPHPSGQQELNVPTAAGVPIDGMQHKYRETVLYFPSQGQTCHAYCTYCFRWAQFVGDQDLKFAVSGPDQLVSYLCAHPQVSDVLVTGGDPMIMSSARLSEHIEPILAVPSVRTIRIGTKSLAYWPHRFVSDPDADDALRLMERIIASGRTCAVMAHFSHPRELEHELTRTALRRIRATGAVVYCQAPLIAHVNDQAEIWSQMWRAELAAGAVPYYMFVERDTGPHDYFQVPLTRASEIFASAYRTLPGLARTVRGPVMSATAGKVLVDGIVDEPTGRFFQLRMLQARDPGLVGRPFRAKFSATASWVDELEFVQPPADIARAFSRSRTPLGLTERAAG
jgi:KamA family protein